MICSFVFQHKEAELVFIITQRAQISLQIVRYTVVVTAVTIRIGPTIRLPDADTAEHTITLLPKRCSNEIVKIIFQTSTWFFEKLACQKGGTMLYQT